MFENISFIADEDTQGRPYYMISNATGKIWLIPDTKLYIIKQAFGIYQPSTAKGKILKSLFPYMPRIFKKKIANIVYLQMHDNWITNIFDKSNLSYSLYLGTPGPHMKPVIQIMDESGNIIAYMKCSSIEKVMRIIDNEVKFIIYLQKKQISSIPTILAYKTIDNTTCLITNTERTSTSKFKIRWNDLYEQCLEEIYKKTMIQDKFCNSDVYKYILSNLTMMENIISLAQFNSIKKSIQILSKYKDNLIDLAFYHRDFKPWNCYINNNKVSIFDLEYSMGVSPVGLDKIHFISQVLYLVKGKTVENISKCILETNIVNPKYIGLPNTILLMIYALDQFILYTLRADNVDNEALFYFMLLISVMKAYKNMGYNDNE